MSKKLPVAKHLNNEEYRILLETYANHNASMSFEKRIEYSASYIIRVERNLKENCLNVYYENGDCWHYTFDGAWYQASNE